MMEVQLSSLDISEVLRYMGCPAHQAGQDLEETVKNCAQSLVKVARPRWTYRTFSISLEEEGVRLSTGLLAPTSAAVIRLQYSALRCLRRQTVSSAKQRAGTCSRLWLWTAVPPLRWSKSAIKSRHSFTGSIQVVISPSGIAPDMGTCPYLSRARCWPCWTPPEKSGCAPAPPIF